MSPPEKLTIFVVNRQISDKMKHLSEQQRYEISALLRAHHSKTEIAAIVGVHKPATRVILMADYLTLSGKRDSNSLPSKPVCINLLVAKECLATNNADTK